MDIELIDKAWACLPREFKEEVKRLYRIAESDVDQMIAMIMLENVFGIHNLTSDAEGEETLICEKSKVQRAYNTSREIVKAENPDSLMYSMHTQVMCVLESIFGTKCLPDEDVHEDNFTSIEPKPAEPKFKIGDELALDKRIVVKVDEVFADGKYLVYSRIGNIYMVKESDLEPYTEPVGTKNDTKGNTKDPTFTDDCKSQCKSPDRLRIAAMAMEGILSKGELAAPDEVTDMALIYADELIKKCEEGSTL